MRSVSNKVCHSGLQLFSKCSSGRCWEGFFSQPGWSVLRSSEGRDVIPSPDTSLPSSCPHLNPNSNVPGSWTHAKLAMVVEKQVKLLMPSSDVQKVTAGDTGSSRVNPTGQPFQSRPRGGAKCDFGTACHCQGAVQIAEG